MNAQPEFSKPDASSALTLPTNTGVVVTPMEMLGTALANPNMTPDTLEKLLALQERWERTQARKSFDAAMANAKAEFEPIIKNRRVAFESKKGGADTDYRHEDLAQIERQISPILTKHGLSYRFRAESEPEQPVRVTCIIAHREGHSEETTLAAGRDASGNKNSIQAIGSAITYLQRYTLKAALGLAVAHDDDGGKADHTSDDGPISEEQASTIRKLAEDNGRDLVGFCKYFKIEAVPELPAKEYDRAISALSKKVAK